MRRVVPPAARRIFIYRLLPWRPGAVLLRVVERVEHVDQTIGEEKEEINIKHLFNIWRV
jgi:hypothetical protein